jgi:uncharacterized membrane protein YhaH (DUF805 family)
MTNQLFGLEISGVLTYLFMVALFVASIAVVCFLVKKLIDYDKDDK